MQRIYDFVKDIINDDQSMDSLIIYQNGRGYDVNKKNDEVFDVRSISKTVLALVCGLLIEESSGDFNLDTYIYPIIKDKINLRNKKNHRYLKKVKVGHLLTHTTGYRDLVMLSKDLKEKDFEGLFDYIINYEIYYEPGSHFLYSNAGYYLLAIAMEEYLGYPLFDFVEEKLLKPIDINNRDWGKYGNYLAGATKIYLNADDMLKLGKLIMNKGKYNGNQIISSTYIQEMLKIREKNLNETKREYLSEDYYGLGLWISEAGVIFASGTGGQLIVMLNDIDTVIVTTNSKSDSKSYRIKADVDKLIPMLYENRR